MSVQSQVMQVLLPTWWIWPCRRNVFARFARNNPLLGIDKLVCNSELARNLNVIFKEQLLSLVSQLMLASHSCKDPEETQTEDSMHVT